MAKEMPRFANPLEDPGWDERVVDRRETSFFHGASWGKVLQATYGHHPMYFVVLKDGKLHALLPLMEVRSPLTGTRGVSLPFTDECQPIGFSPSEYEGVFHSLLRQGRERQWDYLEFRGGRDLMPRATPSLCYYGHTLDLQADDEALSARFKSSVRQAIRKAARHGVKAQITTAPDAVEAYYRLHWRTRRKHGVPPQPWAFFSNLHRHVLSKGQGFVCLASLNERPIAGAIFLLSGRKAIYKFGASDERALPLRGNNLLMWAAIQWLCRHGFEQLDFGRTSMANPGLRQFKLGWGTVEKRIEYFKYDLDADRFVTDRDLSSGWYNWVFRSMPSALFRLTGALLCRHLSSWAVAPEMYDWGLFA
jgi:CelD/BcsL family acetyltransferase involved in cellulose biosynthesis